ncbi:MAG: hypothetical protein ABSC55_00345 [Syntrophorhabdales bacterium]|jgi:hypothetical protein
MSDKDDSVWLWNANLAWELFSSAVYSYRLSLATSKEHQRHSFFKTVILNSITSVEAYFNEILAKEDGWSEKALKAGKWSEKIHALGIDFGQERFSNSKLLRNDFIVHHKRIDYRYFVEINQATALDAIESSQDIIAELSYKRNRIFPYWITGLNFINPSHANDIWLLNDYEFWCRFKWLGINRVVDQMITNGNIEPPKERNVYDSLYKELWQKLKDCSFKLDILNNVKDKRFPLMPFLTSEWWVID